MPAARLATGCTLALLVAGAGFAQDTVPVDPAAPAPAPEAAPATTRPRVIDEIVVTAQKKAENLQDVPISITVLTGEYLKEAGIDDMHELVQSTPNVRYSVSVGTVFIRGIGNPFGSSAFEPSVGLALDELSINNPIYMADPLYDLERFEVLRGPQGTLFGKNTPAGLFSLTTAKPSREWTGYAIGRTGELGVDRLEAAVGGPLADWLQVRVAGVNSNLEEDLENTRLDTKEPGARQRAGRVQVAIQPLDALDILLIGSRATTRSMYLRSQNHAMQPDDVTFLRQYDAEFEDDGYDHQNSLDLDDPHRRTTKLAQSNIRLSLGDLGVVRNAAVVAVLGDTRLDDNTPYDGDLSPASIVYLPITNIRTHQRSGELRFSGDTAAPIGSGQIDFLAAALLFDADLDSDYKALAGEDFLEYLATPAAVQVFTGVRPPTGLGFGSLAAFAAAIGAPPPVSDVVAGDGFEFLLDQNTRSHAFFGRVAWKFSEQWSASVGGRYSKERKKAHLQNLCFQAGLLCTGLGVDRFELDARRTEDDFSPRFTVEYAPVETLTLFATRSKGFKSGGYNNLSFTADAVEVEPERTVSWELGAKGRLFDGSVRYGATLFRMTIDDMQVQNIRGTFLLVQNAAKARSQGLELDVQWLTPWEPLSVSGSAAFTDATYESYPNAPAIQGSGESSQDLSGERLSDVARFQCNVTPTLRLPLGSKGLELLAATDVLYRGGAYLTSDLDPRHRQDDYVLVDARLFLTTSSDRWSVGVAGKNLTDEKVAELIGGNSLFPGGSLVTEEFQRRFFVEARFNW
ncbi:MAG TPA: TonB-dependent receptor [Nevskiaceae bacterium]|nr:TonB-dependent receptor [Nevskiaceae bacterium]